jgi:hypothetical protein
MVLLGLKAMHSSGIGKRLRFAALRRWSALPLALILLSGGLTTAVVASIRFAELEENSTITLRCEELSHSNRINPQRLHRVEAGRITSAPSMLSPRTLGHRQHLVLNTLDGHRLPNGLLAPITC